MLKQKLFDFVPESECAERQGPPSSAKWVLKNKGEQVRARLVVKEIKKARSEDEKLESSDVFSAMPPAESLKALASHVWCLQCSTCQEHTSTVRVNAMFTWSLPQNYIVLDSQPNSTKRCTGRRMRAMRSRN